MRRILHSLVLAAVFGAPGLAAAQTGTPANDAFERKDFTTAFRLWQEEAEAGSADAELALGLLYDLGLGVSRDAEAALEWYLKAAEGGLAEAQFNAAVMLDSGVVGPPDRQTAAALYARAGLNGNVRAQYNLAMLYQTGQGVPRNPDLARYWLTRAAENLPAAAVRLAELDDVAPAQGPPGAPVQLTGAVVETPDARPRAELVWAAAPGPPDAMFLVEIATLAEGSAYSGRIVQSLRTEGSAIAVPLSGTGTIRAWRVSRIGVDPAQAVSAPWQILGDAPPDTPARLPNAQVTLRLTEGDDAAARFAGEVAASLFEGGLWVEVQQVTEPAAQTSVTYFHAADESMARAIANYLPVLDAADALRAVPPPGALPGEIVVRLVGGPQG